MSAQTSQARFERHYIMSGPNPVTMQEIDAAREAGATGIALMVHHEDDDRKGVDWTDYNDQFVPVRPFRNEDEFAKMLERIKRELGEVALIVWARPVCEWEEAASRYVHGLHRAVGLDHVFVDTERHNRNMRIPRHFQTWQEWCEYHARTWRLAPTNDDLDPFSMVLMGYLSIGQRDIQMLETGIYNAFAHMGYGDRGHSPATLRGLKRWLDGLLSRLRDKVPAGIDIWHGQGAYDLTRTDGTAAEVIESMCSIALTHGCTSLATWQLETMDRNIRVHRQMRRALARVMGV